MSLPKFEIKVQLKDTDYVLEVVAINPDLIRYEMEAQKRGLPTKQEAAPMTWLTFLAWAALTREGRYSGEWQKFKLEDCIGVESPEEDDVAETDPTPPAHEWSSV